MTENRKPKTENPLTPERGLELQALAARLGYAFHDPAWLAQAMRHRSFVHENPESGLSNERLEFLGDAVLALTVSNLLLQAFPDSPEGELSRRRAALVNARRLAGLARRLRLGDYLQLGRGEAQQSGRDKPSLLANALEAVLGAVFQDGGLNAAAALIGRWFAPLMGAAEPLPSEDFKTALQELTQARLKLSPRYRVLAETGPGHDKHFRVEVALGERPLAQGEGRTKKQASQEAARLALMALEQDEPV